eukprot:3613442-Karenia_brevis.AAC.1
MSGRDPNHHNSIRPEEHRIRNVNVDCMPNEDELHEEKLEGEIEVEDEIVGERSQDVPIMRGPVLPKAGEIEAHNMTGHAVYRTWCAECVRGSGQNAPHQTRVERGPHDLPKISFDYGFLSAKTHSRAENEEAERDGQSPMLVYWDAHS